MGIKIIVDGEEWTPANEQERKPIRVEMWYDRHYRHWVIYPVDADGNQTQEARYGFGKKDATNIKKELEREVL